MQVSKLISALCALTVITGFTVRADDTPAQAAARAAMEAKIRALNAQQSGMQHQMQSSPMNGTSDTDAAERALHQKMAELNAQENISHTSTSTTKAVVVPMTVTSASSEAQAQAQAALNQKMAELNAGKNVGMSSSDSEAQAKAQAALNQKMAELNARKNANAVSPASSEAQAQAHAALDQKMMELNRQKMAVQKPMVPKPQKTPPPQMQAVTESKPAAMQPAPPVAAASMPPPAATTPPPAKSAPAAATPYPGQDLGFRPIAAPPLPVSTSKEAQLHALLQQYMANQITPDEYQKKRAEIMTEPDVTSH